MTTHRQRTAPLVAEPLGPAARILDAASELFYARGVRATGINLILERAGAARASFYDHYPSKNDLVRAWLRRPSTEWFIRARREVDDQTDDPRDRVLAMFDWIAAWSQQPDYRGCPFNNFAVSEVDLDAELRSVTIEMQDHVRDYLRGQCARFGVAEPESLADAAFSLVPGSLTLAMVQNSDASVRSARRAVETLLSTASAPPASHEVPTHPFTIARKRNPAEIVGSARDRVLDAADELFSTRGIYATGVDALIARSSVAKATFYRHFPSKEDLVVAWLEQPSTTWLHGARADLADLGLPPAERIVVFFDWLRAWATAGEFRGCPHLNAVLELADPGPDVRDAITIGLDETRSWLNEQVVAAGLPDADELAVQLAVLVTGAIVLATCRRETTPIVNAKRAAAMLVGSVRTSPEA